MSILGILGETTTIAGPLGTTAWNCFDHDKGTFQFKYNEKKTVGTLKKVSTTVAGVSVSSSLQFGGEVGTNHLTDLYADAMSAEQIYEMEQLLAAKETEFTVNGKTYDLAEVDTKSAEAEMGASKDTKVLQKSL